MERICEKCLENKNEKEFTDFDRGVCNKCLLGGAYKQNVIELVVGHKKHCNHSDCNVSLILLLEMAQKVGIKFNDEEMKIFI